MVLHSIELCAGVGMLGEGVRAACELLGIEHRTVCYVEREAAAAAQLARLMEAGAIDPAPVWSDLLTFDGAAWRGCVDFLIAGFPCQDISIAGRRAGLDGQRSGLFFDILDIADACQARGIVLENVAAIATATATAVDEAEGVLEERAAARVVGELADRGWDAEWITLSASDVGASHGRARWFCLAWRREMGHTRHHAGCAEHREQSEIATCWPGKSGKGGDGRALGDAERARWPQTGGGSEIHPGRELEPRCGDVDDAYHAIGEGRGLPAGEGQERADPGRPGEGADGAMAHASCDGRDQGRPEPGGKQGRPDAAQRCGAVADACEPGLPHAEQPEPAGERPGLEGRAAPELRGAPLFAPGPLDPRWSAIVSNRPDLAPAVEPGVCLLADGMAYLVDESRAHQLRQVGNGVVPLQAAVALVELVRRAMN